MTHPDDFWEHALYGILFGFFFVSSIEKKNYWPHVILSFLIACKFLFYDKRDNFFKWAYVSFSAVTASSFLNYLSELNHYSEFSIWVYNDKLEKYYFWGFFVGIFVLGSQLVLSFLIYLCTPQSVIFARQREERERTRVSTEQDSTEQDWEKMLKEGRIATEKKEKQLKAAKAAKAGAKAAKEAKEEAIKQAAIVKFNSQDFDLKTFTAETTALLQQVAKDRVNVYLKLGYVKGQTNALCLKMKQIERDIKTETRKKAAALAAREYKDIQTYETKIAQLEVDLAATKGEERASKQSYVSTEQEFKDYQKKEEAKTQETLVLVALIKHALDGLNADEKRLVEQEKYILAAEKKKEVDEVSALMHSVRATLVTMEMNKADNYSIKCGKINTFKGNDVSMFFGNWNGQGTFIKTFEEEVGSDPYTRASTVLYSLTSECQYPCNYVYTGGFKNGKFHGKGEKHAYDGKLIFASSVLYENGDKYVEKREDTYESVYHRTYVPTYDYHDGDY